MVVQVPVAMTRLGISMCVCVGADLCSAVPSKTCALLPLRLNYFHLLFVQHITPWDVKGGSDGKIDYNKLSRDVRSPLPLRTYC